MKLLQVLIILFYAIPKDEVQEPDERSCGSIVEFEWWWIPLYLVLAVAGLAFNQYIRRSKYKNHGLGL